MMLCELSRHSLDRSHLWELHRAGRVCGAGHSMPSRFDFSKGANDWKKKQLREPVLTQESLGEVSCTLRVSAALCYMH